MGIEAFKPTIWSSAILANVEKNLVYGNIAARSFEGDLQFGQAVKLNEISDISVSDYDGSSSLSWNRVDGTVRELIVDQQKSFSFRVEDADKLQSKADAMAAATQNAAFQLADTADQYIAGLYAEAGALDATNLGATGAASDIEVNANDMIEIISYMHKALDSNNAPRAGRWAVFSPELIQYLVYAYVIQGNGYANTPNDPAASSGFVQNAMGFRVYMSNNVSSNGTEERVMFGAPGALQFVEQIKSIEAMRLQDYHADGVRGLHLYGAKAMRPDWLGCAYLNPDGLTS